MGVKNENNQFAEDKVSGKVYHISELTIDKRGLRCGCICPKCGADMQARMGKKRIWHFAHHSDASVNCSSKKNAQSALHKLAKEIIVSNSHIIVPQYELDASKDPNRNMLDKNQMQPYHCFDSFDLKYNNALLEQSMEGFRPDILLKADDEDIIVEIAVTHKVEDDKLAKIKQKMISAIEIDLLVLYSYVENYNKEKLVDAIINNVENKHWIYNRNEDKYIAKLIERNRKFEEEYQLVKAQKEEEARAIREQKERAWEEARLKEEEEYRLLEQTRIENDRRKEEECKAYLEQITQAEYARKKAAEERKIILEQSKKEHNNNDTNDAESNKVFMYRSFYDLAMEKYNGIPFFCNIKIEEEYAFKCDRRIWQMFLFDKFFYSAKTNKITASYIYKYYIVYNRKLINEKVVDVSKIDTKRPNHILRDAIIKYLFCLRELGFIISEFVGGSFDFERRVNIITHDIIPPNKDAIKKYINS